jgi:hypothetical protein
LLKGARLERQGKQRIRGEQVERRGTIPTLAEHLLERGTRRPGESVGEIRVVPRREIASRTLA